MMMSKEVCSKLLGRLAKVMVEDDHHSTEASRVEIKKIIAEIKKSRTIYNQN
jgi:hypothetical protein